MNIYDINRGNVMGMALIGRAREPALQKGIFPEGHVVYGGGWQIDDDSMTADEHWLAFDGDRTARDIAEGGGKTAMLYRTVAATAFGVAAVVKLATEYGPLGYCTHYKDGQLVERLFHWYSVIICMRQLCFLQDYLGAADPTHKRQLIRAHQDDWQSYHHVTNLFNPDRIQDFGWLGFWTARSENWGVDTWNRAAAQDFQMLVNECLANTCKPLVKFSPSPSIGFEAKGLLPVAVATFVRGLLGNASTPKVCPGCGEWFLPVHGKSRHCSDSCRTQAYRVRKSQRLAGGGES